MRSNVLAAALVVLSGASLSAHRMDEYLQAARIGIEPGRVDLELDLTPGTAVFDSVIAAIDRDRDGTVSSAERDAYVSAVFDAIALTVDGQTLAIDRINATFPEIDVLRRGEGIVQLSAGARLPALGNGAHQLTFRNSHRPDVSVYLANALVPVSDVIAITAQHRDRAQVALAIDFTINAQGDSAPPALGFMAAALAIAVVLLGATARGQASARSTRAALPQPAPPPA